MLTGERGVGVVEAPYLKAVPEAHPGKSFLRLGVHCLQKWGEGQGGVPGQFKKKLPSSQFWKLQDKGASRLACSSSTLLGVYPFPISPVVIPLSMAVLMHTFLIRTPVRLD